MWMERGYKFKLPLYRSDGPGLSLDLSSATTHLPQQPRIRDEK
jgi:hypothetical protein